jgi:hypothetical protein
MARHIQNRSLRQSRARDGRTKAAAAAIGIAVHCWNRVEADAARDRLLALANSVAKSRRLANRPFVFDRSNPPTRPMPGFPDWWIISGAPVELSRYTSERGTGRRSITAVFINAQMTWGKAPEREEVTRWLA